MIDSCKYLSVATPEKEHTMNDYHLIGTQGCGSTIVEAMFELAGLPYTVDYVDYASPGPGRDRLLRANPLGQVPTLLLPDGTVMTESAAIALYIADRAPQAGLVPGVNDPLRPVFLRWLIFLVAALYPTFTYGDDPAKWVDDEAAGKALRSSTDEHRKKLWQQVEAQAQATPWFLGTQFSAIDIYIAVMSYWRPGRNWFKEQCPKLTATTQAVEALPKAGPAIKRNMA
jgi:GST-like protein